MYCREFNMCRCQIVSTIGLGTSVAAGCCLARAKYLRYSASAVAIFSADHPLQSGKCESCPITFEMSNAGSVTATRSVLVFIFSSFVSKSIPIQHKHITSTVTEPLDFAVYDLNVKDITLLSIFNSIIY